MMYKTHLATSIALGAGIAKIISFPFTIGFLGGVSLGSLLPDIDEPNSFIGRRSFGIARVINKRYGHRGMTHSFFVWIVLSFILLLIPNLFTIGISLG
jgi:inner membrane protein